MAGRKTIERRGGGPGAGAAALAVVLIAALLAAAGCSGGGVEREDVVAAPDAAADRGGLAQDAELPPFRDVGGDGVGGDVLCDAADVWNDGAADVPVEVVSDVPRDVLSDVPPDVGGDVPADVTTDVCACAEGPCCDGCRLLAEGAPCDDRGEVERGCPWGVRCGSAAGLRYRPRLCSGVSAACDGALGEPGAWEVAESCLPPAGCVAGACGATATCEGATCPEASCPVIGESAGVCNETTGHCEYVLSPETGTWVLLLPGSFEMGYGPDEIPHPTVPNPRRQVTLTRPFLMRTTELTQGEWLARMGNEPYWPRGLSPDYPVAGVSWWEALAYCNALSAAEGLDACYALENCTGQPGVHVPYEFEEGFHPYDFQCEDPKPLDLDCAGYRLPTEAEWEYACRSGSPTELYTGAVWAGEECDAPEIDDLAWYAPTASYPPYDSVSCASCFWENPEHTCGVRRVGLKLASPWGLYDMLGNADEAVNDTWGAFDADPVADPLGPEVESPSWLVGRQVTGRGGSAFVSASSIRCTSRWGGSDKSFGDHVGFRPVRTVP